MVTSLEQKVSGKSIKTFSIGFYDKEKNEVEFAAETAKYLGTDHHELYVSEQDIFDMIKDLPYYYDEPFSDSSQLPCMLVSKMASEHITVALSGDAGDELFCGYKMYDWTWIVQNADWRGYLAYKLIGNSPLMKHLSLEVRAFILNRDQNKKTQLFINVVSEEVEKIFNHPLNDVKYKQAERFAYKNW